MPNLVIAQKGDTLRSLAARIFGDESLWYVLAEENGLTDPNAELEAGSQLRVPNDVVAPRNDASSFKPFDVREALGDTAPTQPMPPANAKKGCGIIGTIIIVIVVIVVIIVTIFTWGAGTAPAVAGGSAVTAGSVATAVAVGAATAAATNAVTQLVSMALGYQDKFNWKSVAASAVAGGLTAGIGAVGGFGAAFGELAPVANAIGNNAVTQGVNIAFGLQKSFDWKSVAAAAVTAPLTGAISGGVSKSMPKFTTNFINEIAGGVVTQAFSGGKLDMNRIVADAFGSALGNSIVDRMSPQPAPAARSGRSGLNLDADIEAGIAGTRARNEPELLGMAAPSLDNNPRLIDPSVSLTPDQLRSANSGDLLGSVIEEVVVNGSRRDSSAGYRARLDLLRFTGQFRVPADQLRRMATTNRFIDNHALGIADTYDLISGAANDVFYGRNSSDRAAQALMLLAGEGSRGQLLSLTGVDPNALDSLEFGDQLDLLADSLLGKLDANVEWAGRLNTAALGYGTEPEARRFLDLMAGDFEGVGERGFFDAVTASMPGLGFEFARGQDARVAMDRRVLEQSIAIGLLSPDVGTGLIEASRSVDGQGYTDAALGILPIKPALLAEALSFAVSDAHAASGANAAAMGRLGRMMGVGVRAIQQVSVRDLVGMVKGLTASDLGRVPLTTQTQLPASLQRAILSVHMGAAPFKGALRHHLIPLEALKQYPDLMRRAAEGGFDINSKANGAWLRSADHYAGHPEYNRVVLTALGELNPRLSPTQLARDLGDIARTLNSSISRGTFGPWR